jgi:hypothetical protein
VSEDFELQVGLIGFLDFLKPAIPLRTCVDVFYENEDLCSWLAEALGGSRSGLVSGRSQGDKQDKAYHQKYGGERQAECTTPDESKDGPAHQNN